MVTICLPGSQPTMPAVKPIRGEVLRIRSVTGTHSDNTMKHITTITYRLASAPMGNDNYKSAINGSEICPLHNGINKMSTPC
jgi:hypothetical protein